MILTSIIGQIIIGWILADLLSGIFHWWEDRIGWSTMPLIGKYVIIPNREHHKHPMLFTKSTVIQRNAIVWLIVVIISTIWFYITGFTIIWLVTTLISLVANEIHVQTHIQNRNKFIRVLQDSGLIQSPKHHSLHHKYPNDKNYCIVSNFLNPFLNHFKVWFYMEQFLCLIGLEPNRGTK